MRFQSMWYCKTLLESIPIDQMLSVFVCLTARWRLWQRKFPAVRWCAFWEFLQQWHHRICCSSLAQSSTIFYFTRNMVSDYSDINEKSNIPCIHVFRGHLIYTVTSQIRSPIHHGTVPNHLWRWGRKISWSNTCDSIPFSLLSLIERFTLNREVLSLIRGFVLNGEVPWYLHQ